MQEIFDKYYISDDKNLLSISTVYEYLSRKSYWAKNRSLSIVKKSIKNSMCIGVYKSENIQVGFARIITDYATSYYICDLFVLEIEQSKGLGKKLVEFIVSHPDLDGLSAMLLTKDAYGLYRKFGFSDDKEFQNKFMYKKKESL